MQFIRIRSSLVAALAAVSVLTLGACEDQVAAPPVEPPSKDQVQAPSGWLDGMEIASVSGWSRAIFNPNQSAYGMASTSFYSTHGRAGLTIRTSNSSGLIASGSNSKTNSYPIPPLPGQHYTVQTSRNISAGGAYCGVRVDVDGTHRAWTMIPLGYMTSEAYTTSSDWDASPNCNTDCDDQIIIDPWDECAPSSGDGGGGNNGGGSGDLECTTVFIQILQDGEVIWEGYGKLCE